ncbi:DUF916 domain-containing protein (plasmid) [Lactococcus garvieae]|uniref:DUF916 domain-containing protein n=1 Tax=Lactococcus garvieae TaxID=1363 RepID=UPI0030D1B540
MKKIITLIFPVLFIFLGGVHMQSVHADSPELSIETVLPDNQINKKLSYFDLNISPNLKQNLVLKVKNNGSTPLKIDIDITDGYTTFNGDLDYSITDTHKKISVPLSIKKIITPDKKVIELDAKEEQEISLSLSVPEDIQEGIILGGVRFRQHQGADSENSKNETVSNEYAYVKGIKLTYGDIPSVKLKTSSARLSNIQHQPTVLFDFSNKTASIGLDIQLKTRVEEKNSGKVVAEDISKVDMAPYANATLPVKLEEKKLPAGDYKLIVNIQGKGIKEEDQILYFKVTEKESQKTKEVASQVEQYIPTWLIIVGIALFLLLLVLIGIVLYQRKNRTKSSK